MGGRGQRLAQVQESERHQSCRAKSEDTASAGEDQAQAQGERGAGFKSGVRLAFSHLAHTLLARQSSRPTHVQRAQLAVGTGFRFWWSGVGPCHKLLHQNVERCTGNERTRCAAAAANFVVVEHRSSAQIEVWAVSKQTPSMRATTSICSQTRTGPFQTNRWPSERSLEAFPRRTARPRSRSSWSTSSKRGEFSHLSATSTRPTALAACKRTSGKRCWRHWCTSALGRCCSRCSQRRTWARWRCRATLHATRCARNSTIGTRPSAADLILQTGGKPPSLPTPSDVREKARLGGGMGPRRGRSQLSRL